MSDKESINEIRARTEALLKEVEEKAKALLAEVKNMDTSWDDLEKSDCGGACAGNCACDTPIILDALKETN